MSEIFKERVCAELLMLLLKCFSSWQHFVHTFSDAILWLLANALDVDWAVCGTKSDKRITIVYTCNICIHD